MSINYDRPVLDLIDELSATGHVTHTKHRKRSVTLHHNGGLLTRRGVLNVWKSRPASAHFDVDKHGNLAQYVRVLEYAWATGDTKGNIETISIEHANISLSPHWEVAEPTWREGARLAGWLFAKVIEEHPNRHNLLFHHHWKATSCAGPFMEKHYEKILERTQRSYDYFMH